MLIYIDKIIHDASILSLCTSNPQQQFRIASIFLSPCDIKFPFRRVGCLNELKFCVRAVCTFVCSQGNLGIFSKRALWLAPNRPSLSWLFYTTQSPFCHLVSMPLSVPACSLSPRLRRTTKKWMDWVLLLAYGKLKLYNILKTVWGASI